MKIIKNSSEGIKEAAEILSADGIVAFPTETVYGLGANAFSEEAVTKVYKIKKPIEVVRNSFEKNGEIEKSKKFERNIGKIKFKN